MKNTSIVKFILVILYLGIISAACTIPFLYETPSLFYKTGIDKIMLRTGKVFGIIAGTLMIIQLVFVSRIKRLETVFGLKNLFNWHRASGLIILVAALVHPVLILGADHFVFFPLESKYWPEFAGIILLVLLTFFVLVSHWQKRIGVPFKTWRLLHRFTAPVILVLMAVHVVNVSRSFESGLPFWGFFTMLGVAGLVLIGKYLKSS